MKFNINLINLRKQNNMSQEELADKLNVTRQTIYKWESGETYPTTDKLIDIAKIFNVNIDKLINEDLNDKYTKEDVVLYTKRFSYAISLSVGAIILSVALLICINAFGLTYNLVNYEIISAICMLAIIFIAVLVIIFSSIKYDEFIKYIKEDNLILEFLKKEIHKSNNVFIIKLIIGIGLIFLGVLNILIFSMFEDEILLMYSIALLLGFIAIGVFFIVQTSILNGLFKDPNSLFEEKKKSGLSSLIFFAFLGVFLACGFIFNAWPWCWIFLPIGGIIGDIFDKKTKLEE